MRAPLLIAPAMNTNMLEHPATRAHLATLVSRGARVVEPGSGELACGWLGPGRLAELPDLVAAVEGALAGGRPASDLAGRRVVIAAGPTREPLDPVRYLTNRSSGRMGFELAREARARGATVTLVLGPTPLEPPPGVEQVRVETALEMEAAVGAAAAGCDALVMAAAVADFRPERVSPGKLKPGGRAASLALVPNPDILAGLGAARLRGAAAGPRVLVGFAAETGDPEAEAIRKLGRKACDLVVGNRVGRGRVFDSDRTEAVLVERMEEGAPAVTRRAPETKRELAAAVWSAVARRLGPSGS